MPYASSGNGRPSPYDECSKPIQAPTHPRAVQGRGPVGSGDESRGREGRLHRYPAAAGATKTGRCRVLAFSMAKRLRLRRDPDRCRDCRPGSTCRRRSAFWFARAHRTSSSLG